MRQFDVCPLRRSRRQFVVILQHDLLDDLATRVVAPLADTLHAPPITILRVPVEIDGVRRIVQVDRAAAISVVELDRPVASLASEERRLKSALDLLFFGV